MLLTRLISITFMRNKLHSVGIKGFLLHWTNSYMTVRKLAGCHKINVAMPQGFLLGPLLFNLYINDVTNNVDDDTFI